VQNCIQLIPQRDPFVMVHNLLMASETEAVTQFEIYPDNKLVNSGYFSETGMLENIAQTAAAHAGYLFKKKEMPIPIGYIANVKDFKVFDLPPVGAKLTTSVRIVNQVMAVTLAEGIVKCDEKILCQCEIRIFINQ
jgi:3-hydroxyacyl-[acyl-carrier-protein] dehydratase